jgi:hypothetical protein
MTEEEAKTKWCCGPLQNLHTAMFQAAASVGDTEGHFDDLPAGGLCIGSSCMAWLWLPYYDGRKKMLVRKGTRVRVSSGNESNSEWVLEDPGEPAPAQAGYCGLAGKP